MTYDPSEPRVPSGSSQGGQWTTGGGFSSGGELAVVPKRYRNDYNLGRKIRKAAGGHPGLLFLEEWAYGNRPSGLPEFDTVPGFSPGADDPVRAAFVAAGMEGYPAPSPTVGWRFGAAPEVGNSRNYVEGKMEAGVSMAHVEHPKWRDYQWFMGTTVRKRYYYSGYVLHHVWGSDGEPLMVGVKNIDAKQYAIRKHILHDRASTRKRKAALSGLRKRLRKG